MAIALDIIKKKSGLDDTLAQQALDIKNSQGNDAFKAFVTKNKPVQPVSTTPIAPAPTPAPQPIVNAPVDQTTGLSKPLEPVAQPVQPAPVVPATPTPLQAEVKTPEVKPVVASSTQKIEAPIDYTQAKGREQDIINNLNTFKAQNMTPEQIIKASDYQNATPEKKALIEPYLKQQVPTASAMYNNIVAKADIPDEQKTSLPYKIASNRYAKANMYSTMTPSQLSSEMTNSKLIQGSQAYEDLKAMNPKLVQDTENLRIVNGSKQNVFTYVNNPDGTTTKTNNLENTFAEDYMDNFKEAIQQMFTVQTPEQIRAIINTPDVIAAQDKATQIELGMNELEKQIENVDSDVEAEMKGSGATGSRIALEKASRKEKLEKEYNSQLKNYTTYANKANNLITQNTTLYTNSQAQKVQQANAMLPILQDQYKTAQAKAQAEQALQDPATAIKSVMDEYKKLGIPFTSTVQSRLAEFKASGKPLEQFLTEMGQNIQASPAYQQYQALQQGQMSDVAKMKAQQDFELKKIGLQKETKDTKPEFKVIGKNKDGTDKYGWVNASTQTVTPYGETGKTTIPDGTSLFDVLGKNVGTYEGNRGYDLAGALGDPLPAGGNWTVKSIDTAGEQVGSIFIGGKGKKPYGNTVVMEDENGNEIRYSHLQNIGVKPGDILGFGDIVGTRGNTGNVKGANGETLTAEQLKAGRGAHLDVEIKSKGADGALRLLSNADQVNFLKGLTAGGGYSEPDITIFNSMSPTDKKKSQNDPAYRSFLADYSKIMKDKNAPLQDILKFSSGQNKMGDAESKSLDKFSQALGQISGIQEQISKMDTGPILGRLRNMNPYDTDAQVLKANLQALIPNLARGVYGEVGVLTDADIANYAQTIPNLKSTKDVNNAILAMTLQTMGTGYKSQLQSLASAKNDVSGYGGLYNQYMDIVNQLKSQNTGTQSNTAPTFTPQQQSEFDSLYNGLPN